VPLTEGENEQIQRVIEEKQNAKQRPGPATTSRLHSILEGSFSKKEQSKGVLRFPSKNPLGNGSFFT
jgi:hypothetical protein